MFVRVFLRVHEPVRGFLPVHRVGNGNYSAAQMPWPSPSTLHLLLCFSECSGGELRGELLLWQLLRDMWQWSEDGHLRRHTPCLGWRQPLQ